MDLPRRDDQDGLLGNIRQGIDFVSPANSQGAAAEQKKRHVGAERGGDFKEPCCGQFAPREAQIAEQGRCRVAGTSAEPAAGGNFLAQLDFGASTNLQLVPQRINGPVDQILSKRFLRKRFITPDRERNPRTP